MRPHSAPQHHPATFAADWLVTVQTAHAFHE